MRKNVINQFCMFHIFRDSARKMGFVSPQFPAFLGIVALEKKKKSPGLHVIDPASKRLGLTENFIPDA